MNKYLKYIFASIFTIILASCMNSNLDEIETYSESNITNIRFEYRWITSGNKLNIKTLTVEKTINNDTHVVECSITVPASDATFTADIRNKVSLANLCGYLTLSTGASATPIGNAPVLGTVSDFSAKDFDYEVTAANKSKTTWKVKIKEFTK